MTTRNTVLSLLVYIATIPCWAQQCIAADVFCDIIAGKAPATIIYEDDDLIVIEKRKIKDTRGRMLFRASTDCLIIPKKHIVNIKDLDQQDPYDATILSKMAAVAQKLSLQVCAPGDFTITMNNGKTSAQTVFHMHMHFRSPQRWKNPDWRINKIPLGSYKQKASVDNRKRL